MFLNFQFFNPNPNLAFLETLTAILRDQVHFEYNMVMDEVRELIMAMLFSKYFLFL